MPFVPDTRSIGSVYARDSILSASPARLLTMLYDRLLLDLGWAALAQDRDHWPTASINLLHAQDILAELSSTLKVDQWEAGEAMLALYTYASNLLVTANIDRDITKTREVIALLEPLRQSWHEVANGEPMATIWESGQRRLGVA